MSKITAPKAQPKIKVNQAKLKLIKDIEKRINSIDLNESDGLNLFAVLLVQKKDEEKKMECGVMRNASSFSFTAKSLNHINMLMIEKMSSRK